MNDELDPERLRALLDAAARLPREAEPERDAWPEIRARIDAQRVRPLGAPSSRPARGSAIRWVAAATAAVVVIATAVVIQPGKGKARPPQQSSGGQQQGAPAGGTPGAAPVASRAFETVFAQYDQAARELETALAERETLLAPETRVVVRRSLAAIDTAIADLRGALGRDPGNTALAMYLTAAYQQKLDFLKRARALPARRL